MENLSIVYMVAGISSRFQGKIKQFAKVGPSGETLIEYSLNQAIKAGFNKIVFIVGNLTEAPFKEKFGNSYRRIPIHYALQRFNLEERDRPWGTTDALCSAINIIQEPFVVCNGDDIYGENSFKTMNEHLKKSNDEAAIGFRLSKVIPEIGKTNRGIFKVDKNNFVTDLEEVFNIEKNNLSATNTKPDDLCSMNIFALHPKTLHLLNEKLISFKQKNKGDRKAECLLPKEVSDLIKEKEIKMKLYPAKDKWFGVTNPDDEIIVKKQLEELEN